MSSQVCESCRLTPRRFGFFECDVSPKLVRDKNRDTLAPCWWHARIREKNKSTKSIFAGQSHTLYFIYKSQVSEVMEPITSPLLPVVHLTCSRSFMTAVNWAAVPFSCKRPPGVVIVMVALMQVAYKHLSFASIRSVTRFLLRKRWP